MKILDILSWLIGEIGSAAQRHTTRALEFIREASARAEARKQKRK